MVLGAMFASKTKYMAISTPSIYNIVLRQAVIIKYYKQRRVFFALVNISTKIGLDLQRNEVELEHVYCISGNLLSHQQVYYKFAE